MTTELRSHNQTERIGINAVEATFLSEFDWIFREQPVSDFGIDAQVEIVGGWSPLSLPPIRLLLSGEVGVCDP